MIKELTENPEKEFIRKSDGLHFKTNEYGELIWDSGYQFLRLHQEWKEIKKPVDFMTAVESHKRIRIEHEFIEDEDDFRYLTTSYNELDLIIKALSEYTHYDIPEIISNGKWYIED